MDSGLGGGAEDDAGLVVGVEFFEDAETRGKELEGEGLGFVKDDDGAGDPVDTVILFVISECMWL